MYKRCVECGRGMEIADWYAYIRRKYCPACAAAVKRRQNAARMADLRKITRQQNAAVRELCTVQAAELAALRDLIQQQRAELDALKNH